jgi:hypothetical protein
MMKRKPEKNWEQGKWWKISYHNKIARKRIKLRNEHNIMFLKIVSSYDYRAFISTDRTTQLYDYHLGSCLSSVCVIRFTGHLNDEFWFNY